MTARERLDRALLDLAVEGRRPPCGEPWAGELWTSDDKRDRETAARACRTCLVLEACSAAADEADETHHVWAGIDRTRRPSPPRRKGRKP